MYEFVRGPLVWIAFIGFFAGLAYRIITMARLAKKEKVVFPTMDAKFGLRSLLHWVVPFASRNTRMHPLFTLISYAFHICLLVTPLFVMGHAVLWQRVLGRAAGGACPTALADVMTLVVIFGVRLLHGPAVCCARGAQRHHPVGLPPRVAGHWRPFSPASSPTSSGCRTNRRSSPTSSPARCG